MPVRALSVISLSAVLLIPAAPAAGQGSLEAARMGLFLPSGPGAIPVTMELRVRPEPGARELGFTLLTPGDTRIAALRAMVEGRSIRLTLTESRPHYREGALPLPARAGPRAAPTQPGTEGPELRIRLSYVVEGGWQEDGRVIIPIPAPTWPPTDPHPGTFAASATVPRGLTVVESFPTSVVSRPAGAGGGAYEVALQGIPSMLILRVVEGDAPFLTLERVLDTLVIILLLAVGATGVRHLRRGAP